MVTPRCHGTRLQMGAFPNLAPAVPLTSFFRSLVETALPRKRDAFWIRFCRIRFFSNEVEKLISHQPAAPTTSKQNDQSRGAHRGAPRRQSAVCVSHFLASIRRESVRATVAHRSESASGDEVIQPGDHPRPRMLSIRCAGEHPVDMIDEGQWSVSYTQVSFARE